MNVKLNIAVGYIIFFSFTSVFAKEMTGEELYRDSNLADNQKFAYFLSYSSANELFVREVLNKPSGQVYNFLKLNLNADHEVETSYLALPGGSSPSCEFNPKDPLDYYYYCYKVVNSWGMAASPNGKYAYYSYFVYEGGVHNNINFKQVIKNSIQSGPMLGNVLIDLVGTGFGDGSEVLRVNNNGVALVYLQKDYTNSVELSDEFALIYPNGSKKTIFKLNFMPNKNMVDFNDLETFFFWNPGSNVAISIDKNGVYKEIGPMNARSWYQLPRTMWATNIVTEENPEGVLYYLKNQFQLFSSQDGLVMDTTAYGPILSFSANEDKRFIVSAYNAAYNPTSSAIFIGPDLVKDKIIEMGDIINGEVMRFPVAFDLNNNLDYIISYGSPAGPSYSINRDVFVQGSLKPQTCKVADKGVSVKFWSQLDPEWNKPGEYYANVAPGKMSSWGCNTSVNAMLLDAYGLKTMPDGTVTNPGTLNRNLATYLKGVAYPYGVGYTPSSQVVYDGVVATARRGWLNTCLLTLEECLAEANSKVSYKGTKAVNVMSLKETKEIEDEICAGNPVILRLTKTIDSSKTHFVLATGFDYFDDPNNPGQKIKSFIFNDVGRTDADRGRDQNFTNKWYLEKYNLAGYRLYKQAADPPMIFGYGSNNIQYVVTDPLGKMNGFNPLTNISYNQNLDSQYYHESVSNPASEEGVDADFTLTEGFNFENTRSVVDGIYKFEIFGVKDGPYNLTIYSDDKNGNRNNGTNFSGTILKGETKVLRHIASDVVAPIANKKISMAAAIFQNSIRLKNRGQVYFIGKVENFDINDFSSSSNFNISIGSIADYNKVVPISNFRHFLGFSYYAENGVAVYLYKNGNFLISINNVNLDDIVQSKWGLLQLGFGSNIGNAEISLRCQKYSCVMKK
ncbi:MAG: hypothetical protein WA160_02225 [Pseudobdellovibrio sp.]